MIIFLNGATGKSNVVWLLGYVPVVQSFVSIQTVNMKWNLIKILFRIRPVRDIEKGEELFINYNGTFNNEKPLWFDAK